MDKSQKGLVDTYFRKRGIANVQNKEYEFEGYEILYLINNKIPFDFSTLKAGTIADILVKQPSLVNKLDLSKLSYEESNSFDTIFRINYILKYQPQLIDYFDMSGFDEYNITDLLINQPLLIDKVNLSNLNDENITDLLIAQPKLINRLDLSILDDKHISEILKKQPQLAKYFNNRNNG